MPDTQAPAPFAARLLAWFERHGRHDLPWQHPREPYRVWLSEIMLQQTQVATVIPYFQRFLARFPTLTSLAEAPTDDVLAHWAGLGYYARARNLQRCAQHIVTEHNGQFPREFDALIALPGIGRSTAGAILSQAFGQRQAVLDGNVRRVLARHATIGGWTGAPATQKRLWAQAESLLPHERLADYTQALMDLGATVCTARSPRCVDCPVRADCRAHQRKLVSRYPAPKPKVTRPLRQQWLLLIENREGEILCERRPPRGIWGGLWCPPLCDAPRDWIVEAQQRYGIATHRAQTLDTLRHSFTHFELSLIPIHLAVRHANKKAARVRSLSKSATTQVLRQLDPHAAQGEPPASNAAHTWITLDSQDHGLPAPIRKLFRRLHEQRP